MTLLQHTLLAAAALALSPLAHSQETQPAGAIAKRCYTEVLFKEDKVLVTGSGATCGKGSRLEFQRYKLNNWLTMQLCDPNKMILRGEPRDPLAPESTPISCYFTGSIADPDDTYFGVKLEIKQVTPK